MAARLSEVTSQLAATRKSLAIALGRQTAMLPLAWTAPASSSVAALSSPANLSTSARPYCSIARTAILCATWSEKPIVGCAARTASAKGPPPGTMVSGPGNARSAAIHRARSGERHRLPPILTTSALMRARSRERRARGECARPPRPARRHRAFRPRRPRRAPVRATARARRDVRRWSRQARYVPPRV